MAKATVTVRELHNKSTGIDVTILEQTETHGLLSRTSIFRILVVTNLQCFKNESQPSEATVQFVVEKKEEQIHNLHHALAALFPKLVFPVLSHTHSLFGEIKSSNRRSEAEQFLKFIVAHPQTSISYVTLEFFGVNPVVAGNFQRNSIRVMSSKSGSADIFEDSSHHSNEEEVTDLFLQTKADKEDGEILSSNTYVCPGGRLFEDEQNASLKMNQAKEMRLLFSTANEEEDIFVTPESDALPIVGQSEITESELLKLADEFDEILDSTSKQESDDRQSAETLSLSSKYESPGLKRPTVPRKPQILSKSPNILGNKHLTAAQKPNLPAKPPTQVSKPAIPAKKPGSTKKVHHEEGPHTLQLDKEQPDEMDSTDILQYIQSNFDGQEKTVNLFS